MGEGRPRSVPPRVLLTEQEVIEAASYLMALPYDIPVVLDVETTSGDLPDGRHITAHTNNLLWVGIGARGRYFLIPTDHPHGRTLVRRHRQTIRANELPIADPDRYTPTTRHLLTEGKGVLDPGLKVSKRQLTRWVESRFAPRPRQVRPHRVLELLRPVLFDPDRSIVGHNLKFDLETCAKYYDGEIPPGPYHDTIVLQHVLDENKTDYKLKTLIHKWMGVDPRTNPNYYPDIGKLIPTVGMDEAASYLAKDCHFDYMLWHHLYPRLGKLRKIYDFEMGQLYPIVMDMERVGFRMNASMRSEQGELMEQEIIECSAQVSQLVKRLVRPQDLTNINTRRLLMFDPDLGMGHKARVITKTGLPQLDKNTLEYFSERGDAMAVRLLEFSRLEKIKGTFIDGLGTWLDRNSRIHTGYKLHGTVTGRLSSAEPNIQQLPKRSVIKAMFIPSDGHTLVCCDYSQIELRVAAYLSRDPGLTKTFMEGDDPHAMAASYMYGIPIDDVTIEQREVGKTQNFAVLYGAGETKIAFVAKSSVAQAKRLIARYYAAFPGLEPWKAKVLAEAKRRGDRADVYHSPPYVVIPPYGRQRRLPGLFITDNKGAYFHAERQAVNSIIQGFASYICKTAMVELSQLFAGQPVQLLAQVHDEIVLEVANDYAHEAAELVQKTMENLVIDDRPVLGSIPLEAKPSLGMSWADAK